LQRNMTVHEAIGNAPALETISSLLGVIDAAVVVCGRSGRILVANEPARRLIGEQLASESAPLNLFGDLLHVDSKIIAEQLENGEQELDLSMERPKGHIRARVRALSGSDWLVVEMQRAPDARTDSRMTEGTPLTVEALLEERDITYRNLLAAYLRLQEVNRQKTVFLASAAHELKTPLAVVKGYYDLLLSNSLGKLNDKQRDILQESKDSCERLVRLVSMFLNYSTLESGKLVLHLRENDMRDCLNELTTRWNEAFQRKKVRLEVSLDPALPIFKFDYQKVQQTVANLLDNALKHTPAGGEVTLRAEPHFWERRTSQDGPKKERRREHNATGNAVRIAVTDTGPGIASEHHQEIFEDFVRVDRTSSGMGLGLAIAKRLVQAHRGKIWVDSEPRRGCRFTFLLPRENS
jgi:signal transduction histidine kinase